MEESPPGTVHDELVERPRTHWLEPVPDAMAVPHDADPSERARKLFVNLAVRDLERSKAFFTKLGFEINPQLTDEKAACVVVSDEAFVMWTRAEPVKERSRVVDAMARRVDDGAVPRRRRHVERC